jgi:chromate reductase
MARYSIGVIVGSARKGSINQAVVDAMIKLGGPDVEFKQIKIDDLPMFNQDLEGDVPPSVTRLKSEIEAADGLLFATPEYNRSLPPLLINALSWGSRPYGKNSWSGKPAAILGASIGPIRTAAAQAHLRDVLSVLDVRLLGQPEVYIQFESELITADGTVADDGLRGQLTKKIAALSAWVGLVAGATEKKAA